MLLTHYYFEGFKCVSVLHITHALNLWVLDFNSCSSKNKTFLLHAIKLVSRSPGPFSVKRP